MSKIIDLLVTAVLWIYFIFGFLLLFAPRLGFILLRDRSNEFAYQQLYHKFINIFIKLVRRLAPRVSINIDAELANISSGIIIGNHQSYLDPLLMVSLFEKQKTIIKNSFFHVPVFGWLIKKAGYMPSITKGRPLASILHHIRNLKEYLAGGGILFVFPEGTRSRDGRLNKFNKGIFSIAIQCQSPIHVVGISNTNRLFAPGKLLFNTRRFNTINLRLLTTIDTTTLSNSDSAEEIATRVKQLIAENLLLEEKKI